MRSLRACDGLGRQAEGAVFTFLDEITHLHQLAGQVHPLLFVQLFADAVGGETVVAEAQDAFALRAEQNIGHVRGAKAFAGAFDAGEELLRREGDIGQGRGFGVAVIAVVAILGGVGLRRSSSAAACGDSCARPRRSGRWHPGAAAATWRSSPSFWSIKYFSLATSE